MPEKGRKKLSKEDLIDMGFPLSFVDNMGRWWNLSPNGHSFSSYRLPVGYPEGGVVLPVCADYVCGKEEINLPLGHPMLEDPRGILRRKGLVPGTREWRKEVDGL